MTKREYYDLLVHTSLSDGFPAKSGDINLAGGCAYRGDDGRKCAVGLLIPDDVYKPEMEGDGVYRLEADFPEVVKLFPDGLDVGDLSHIQDLHDEQATSGKPWDHAAFVASLDRLSCFADN